jgi:RNA polymerase sigma-70 factor (ECF subfamily)
MIPADRPPGGPVPQLKDGLVGQLPRTESGGWELEWIRSIASGDRSAFERLYHQYQKRVFGYLYRLVGKADIAEELTNDVMLEVWKGAARFKGESKVSTWIFGIARFRAISLLRRTKPELLEIEKTGPLMDPHELEDEVLVKESMRKEVREALMRLSQQHREVIELTFYQEFSYPEIAAILDCPVNTVKTRMFYARKELRQLLNAAGGV